MLDIHSDRCLYQPSGQLAAHRGSTFFVARSMVFLRFPQVPEEILPDLGAEAARLPSGSLKLWLEDVGIIDSLRWLGVGCKAVPKIESCITEDSKKTLQTLNYITELQNRTNRYKYLGYAVCCMPRNHPVLLEHYVLDMFQFKPVDALPPIYLLVFHGVSLPKERSCWRRACYDAGGLPTREGMAILWDFPGVLSRAADERLLFCGKGQNGGVHPSLSESLRQVEQIEHYRLRTVDSCWFGFSIKEPDDAESSDTGQGQRALLAFAGQVQIFVVFEDFWSGGLTANSCWQDIYMVSFHPHYGKGLTLSR